MGTTHGAGFTQAHFPCLPFEPGAIFTKVPICDHRHHTCDEIANRKSIMLATSLILQFIEVIAVAMTQQGKKKVLYKAKKSYL